MAYFGRSLLCDLFKFLSVKDTAMNACKVFLRMKRTPHLDPLRHGETRCATFNLLALRRGCKRRQLGPVWTELYGLRTQATEMCLGYSIRIPHDR